MKKAIKGLGDNDSKHVNIRFKNDTIDIIRDLADKENLTVTEYCRNIINKALITNSDIATTARLVGFDRSNNDKVTKAGKSATFRRTKFKLEVGNV